MLQTVWAEVDVDGNVRMLEPLRVTKPTRALLTLLEDTTAPPEEQDNAAELLELLRSPEFANRRSYPPEVIEAQIQENRNSWDQIESSSPPEITAPEEQSRVIDEIVRRMQSNPVPADAPRFTRESLHERR
jgi:hypothetical protein